MRERPKLLVITCIVLVGIIVSIPLQILLQTDATAVNYSILLNQVTIFNWGVIVACLATMLLTINGHRLLGYSIIPLLFAIHINNYFVFKYALHTQWYMPIFASLACTAIATIFIINKSVRFTMKNQEKRWWLIPKRFQKTLPIWVVLDDNQCVLAHTFDLSKTGTFISTVDGIEKELQQELELGHEVKLLIGDKDDVEFHCNASVVRKCSAKGNYPPGIGLQFKDMSFIEKFHLSRIINNPTLGL